MSKNIFIVEVDRKELVPFEVDNFYDMIDFIKSITRAKGINVLSYDDNSNYYLIECKKDEAIKLSEALDELNINNNTYLGD